MRFLMAVAMFALLAGGTWQIFTRWILRNPSTVTDEFLRYVLIWASMIGSAYCFYKDKHLALDLVKGRAKGAFNVFLSVFIEAAIVFFVGYVFVYGGWKLTANATNVSSVMRIPFKLLYSILPISGIFIILARVLKYVQLFLDSKEKERRKRIMVAQATLLLFGSFFVMLLAGVPISAGIGIASIFTALFSMDPAIFALTAAQRCFSGIDSFLSAGSAVLLSGRQHHEQGRHCKAPCPSGPSGRW